jgi:Icc-related predicted phosphoesterase
MTENTNQLRIAAVADLHRTKGRETSFRSLFVEAEQRADILLICGDLTDYGLAEEAKVLAEELAHAKLPILAVLGNHDFEAGQQGEIAKILGEAGVKVLDGQAHELHGVGFAGAKGFAGGFGVHTLEPWGEEAIKHFVQEGLNEAMKLELALSRLRTPHRIAMLHYSPVVSTVEGEPTEIYPFLGSSRLEEPLNRYQVTAVFHGHAHRGALEGKTRDGIPVYNVSLPLLRSSFPDQPPLRIIELPRTQ